MINNNRHL